MSRFYFNIIDGNNLPDHEGFELPGVSAALTEAVKVAGEMLRDGLSDQFWAGESWQLSVTDGPSATGRVLVLLNITATVDS